MAANSNKYTDSTPHLISILTLDNTIDTSAPLTQELPIHLCSFNYLYLYYYTITLSPLLVTIIY